MKKFELYLKQNNLSNNTITSYLYGVKNFLKNYDLTLEDMLLYKGYLVENFKPKTINLRIQALNKYLEFVGKNNLKLTYSITC